MTTKVKAQKPKTEKAKTRRAKKIMTTETQNPNSLIEKKNLILEILNAIETGTALGNYSDVSIYEDGPNHVRQITYGRSQTTEYGNLPTLLNNYVQAKGVFADKISDKIPLLGKGPLVDDDDFISLLKLAGADPIMQNCQDLFFDTEYWVPSVTWAQTQGFTLPLSMLVIYDSFIQSGHVLLQIRQMFVEVPPAAGGDEKDWIEAYVSARQRWLRSRPLKALQDSAYRTRCFLEQIDHDNWNLDKTPIVVNGVKVG